MTDEELKQRFYNEFWPLNKNGNPDNTINWIALIIRNKTPLHNGVATFDSLLQIYKSYIDQWKYTWGTLAKEEQRYISQNSKLKTIEEFFQAKMYFNSFSIIRTPRDKYLFIDMPTETLLSSVKRF